MLSQMLSPCTQPHLGLPPPPLPHTLTCSRTASRVSKTRTMAPMDFAAPMAARPATPPPMTNTLQGGTRPAAVICVGTQRGEGGGVRVDGGGGEGGKVG